MIKGKFININQGFFHYHALGESENQIHFCHGNSLSAGTYLPFLEKLSSHDLKIYATDIRGHGFSTKENTTQIKSWDIFIKDLEQVVCAITNPPVIGIGHSIGGYFTYAAAALFPHLFSKIVLLDPIILPMKIVWLAALFRKIGLAGSLSLPKMTRTKKSEFQSREEALIHYSGKGMFKSWKPEYVQAYVDTAIEKDTATTWELCCNPEFEAQIYEFVPFNTWQHANHINIPVLVVRGERSDLFHKQAASRLTKIIKNCTFVELKEFGHFLMMEDPDKTIDTILPFI
ncbi:MAG: alpha/beta hydrolase [Desulfobacula sp.]|uniref:alpha/beta fold hydrolase n=1 Tax=Desulfobacula sp. TaxID=2593537 RepID=UPI0025C73A0D|nr:alpha/beta hydrolase [Desulfobacula sp.]MCD4719959.1 alpha/beta hydrolase [Desulfobacula sp.]